MIYALIMTTYSTVFLINTFNSENDCHQFMMENNMIRVSKQLTFACIATTKENLKQFQKK